MVENNLTYFSLFILYDGGFYVDSESEGSGCT